MPRTPLKDAYGRPARLAPLDLPPGVVPVILSLGMGLESVCILIRWLLDPTTRWFPLEHLVVISAQVGHENPETKSYMERIVLPLLSTFGVRYIQVARGGLREADGVVVLSDTTRPTVCHTEGHYRLADELLSVGTVPQIESGKRRCSVKYKGFVLDAAIEHLLGDRPFISVLGFNAEELKRVERDQSYSTVTRQTRHPLVEWGWGRDHCEAYLVAAVGEAPVKSACGFCPFACGSSRRDNHMLPRYRAHLEDAYLALLMEFVASALNPRITLYGGAKSVRAAIAEDGNTAALELFTQRISTATWATYRVRRIYYAPAVADRSVETLFTGTCDACFTHLQRLARREGAIIERSGTGNHPRAYLHRPSAIQAFPRIEEQLVIAPAVVVDKERDRFAAKWAHLTQQVVMDL